MEKNHELLTRGAVLENRNLGSGYYELVFRPDPLMPIPEPGQFLTLKCGDGTTPLLRRPFAAASFGKERASVIFEKRGAGTSWLSGLEPGDTVDILGPLGKGFSLPEKGPVYLAAGGIGLGPMLYTRSVLKARGTEVIFTAGFRDRSRVISALPDGPDVILCTDDGSLGFRGNVTAWLETHFKTSGTATGTILACGPHPMLAACHRFAAVLGLSCQVSVEEIMACGVGACAGCVVPGRDKGTFFRACKDGPVFNSGDLSWT
jgi:dihydroorotate dehydrogenase electron transfer subunit